MPFSINRSGGRVPSSSRLGTAPERERAVSQWCKVEDLLPHRSENAMSLSMKSLPARA